MGVARRRGMGRHQGGAVRRAVLEALEDRRLLSATQYLDLGTATQGSDAIPGWLQSYNGAAYFLKSDAAHTTYQLYRAAPGAPAKAVKLLPPAFYDANSNGHNTGALVWNGSLYFYGNKQLWKTDGTEAGTTLVYDLNDQLTTAAIGELIPAGPVMYIQAGKMWRTDGTPEGTVAVSLPDVGDGAWYLRSSGVLGQSLFFTATESVHGLAVWRIGPTQPAAELLYDPHFPNEDFAGGSFLPLAPRMYFSVPSGGGPEEQFWVDETSAAQPAQINWPTRLLSTGDLTFATAVTPENDMALYRADAEGMSLLTRFPKVSWGWQPHVYGTWGVGGGALSLLDDGDSLLGFWWSDGTAAGTRRIAAGIRARADEYETVMNPVVLEGVLYLTLITDQGDVIWRSDGTPEGTYTLGPAGLPGGQTILGGAPLGSRLLYSAASSADHYWLWTVDPAMPVVADAGVGYSTREGQAITLSGAGSSAAAGHTVARYEWDFDYDGVTFNVDATGVTPTYLPKDDGEFVIALRVTDETIHTHIDTAHVIVDEVLPTVTVTGEAAAIRGDPYTISLAYSDPGDDTISAWTINWGDGVIETTGGTVSTMSHVYTAAGTYSIVAYATDEDGVYVSPGIHAYVHDPSFGADGVTKVAAQAGSAMVVDNRGRIVTVGGGSSINLIRLDASGKADTTFGSAGTVAIDLGFASQIPRAVAVDAQGRTLVAGEVGDASSQQWMVARFLDDGSPDPSFGNNGFVYYNSPSGGSNRLYAIQLQADGKIVVAGQLNEAASGGINLAAARLLADGAFDPTFGQNGIATISWSDKPEWAESLAIQPDGKIVVAGAQYIRPQGYTYDITYVVAARLLSDGTLDGSFGSGGKMTVGQTAGMLVARKVLIQKRGELLIAADGGRVDGNMELIRLSPAGVLDASFAAAGVRTIGGAFRSMLLDQADRILLLFEYKFTTAASCTEIIRFGKNGEGDTTFGLSQPGLPMPGYSRVGPFASFAAGQLDWSQTPTAQCMGMTADGNLLFGATVGASTYYAKLLLPTPGPVVGVINLSPVPDIGGDRTGPEGTPLTITSTIVNASPDVTYSYLWHVTSSNGQVIADQTTPDLTFTPQDQGAYSIILKVTNDSSGRWDTASLTFTATDVPPTLGISSALEQVKAGLPYTVNLQASDPGTDTIKSWKIDWGDGIAQTLTGNRASASHVFTATGTYTVTASATDEDGTFNAPDGVSVTVLPGDMILGAVYADHNASGSRDPGEEGIAGVTVYVDDNANGSLDPGEPTATSDGSGGYSISGMVLGQHRLGAILPEGYAPNPLASLDITLIAASLKTDANIGLIPQSYGHIDESFGTGGRGYLSLTQSASDVPAASALQADGKIVVVSRSGSLPTDLAIARYTVSGSLDPSFGDGGKVVLALNGDDWPTGMAVGIDGRIFITGTVLANQGATGEPTDIFVICLAATGQLDTSFSGTGIRRFDFAADDQGAGIAVQGDGKVVLAGFSKGASAGYYDEILMRLNADGQYDTTFGVNGIFRATGAAGVVTPADVRIDSDGRIVVGGASYRTTSESDFAVQRFLSDGTLDSTFGANGVMTTTIGSTSRIRKIVFDASGRILAAGTARFTYSYGTADLLAVSRYTAEGQIDRSFGSSGTYTKGWTNADARFIGTMSNGRIMVGAYAYSGSSSNPSNQAGRIVCLLPSGGVDYGYLSVNSSTPFTTGQVRADGKVAAIGANSVANSLTGDDSVLEFYTAWGALDTTLGNAGRTVTGFSAQAPALGNAGFALPDGKLLVVGNTSALSNLPQSIVLTRFNADGSVDSSYGQGGQVLLGGSISQLLLNARGLQLPDGRMIVVAQADDASTGTVRSGYVVARLLADGTPDPDFAGGGVMAVPGLERYSAGLDITRTKEGRIVVACSGRVKPAGSTGYTGVYAFAINQDGQLDATFGTGGLVKGTAPEPAFNAASITASVVGRIYIAGGMGLLILDPLGRILRPAAGVMPPAAIGYGLVINAVRALPDGKVLVTGYAKRALTPSDPNHLYAWRLNGDGTTDTSFGANGAVRLPIGQSSAGRSITVMPDGRYLIVGDAVQADGYSAAVTALMQTDGSLSPTFGVGGIAAAEPGRDSWKAGNALLSPAGDVYVIGTDTPYGQVSSPAVMRLLKPQSAAPAIIPGTSGADTFYVRLVNQSLLQIWNSSTATGKPTYSCDPQTLGSLTFATDAGADSVYLDLAGGTLNVPLRFEGSEVTLDAAAGSTIQLGSLSVGHTLKLPAQKNLVLATSRLDIMPGQGTLDLADNSLRISGGNYDQVFAWIQSGRNEGPAGWWSGSGIISSVPAGEDVKGLLLRQSGADVQVKYGYNGDVNGDGNIDADDYFYIDRGLLTHSTGYTNGDLNYDGKVDADDYHLIDAAVLRQTANPAAIGRPVPISPVQQAPVDRSPVDAVPMAPWTVRVDEPAEDRVFLTDELAILA